MSDILNKLRDPGLMQRFWDQYGIEASNEIEGLRKYRAAAEARIAKLEAQLRAAREWNGKDRRCEHSMKWIRDWYGDPSIPNGTADCSRSECTECGWIDPNGEKPERDWDYERDKRIDDRSEQ
jgi:hypothetical protein